MRLSKRHTRTRGGFTLVEIMIVVAIIGLLVAIAVPNFVRARKRSQATQILSELKLIDDAVQMYMLEHKKLSAIGTGWEGIQKYIKPNSRLYNSGGIDLLGNPFVDDGNTEYLRVPTATFNALSDVAPLEFWSPYGP